jgi:catechol 2,3-dioxygenase
MLDAGMRIAAVSLKVADLERCAAFYREIIGLRVLREESAGVEFAAGDCDRFVLRPDEHAARMDGGPGLFHVAFKLPSREDLAGWLRRYADLKAPFFQGASDHGVSEALYLSDPEGNGIEVYCDRPEAQWPRNGRGDIELYTRPLDPDALLRDASDTALPGFPEAGAIGHIHLRVNDIEAARKFYVDTLGFALKSAYGESALFVAAGEYHHHIGLNTWQSLDAPALSGNVYGLAEAVLALRSRSELAEVAQALVRAGTAVTPADGDSFTVRDPSGNQLRFVSSTRVLEESCV